MKKLIAMPASKAEQELTQALTVNVSKSITRRVAERNSQPDGKASSGCFAPPSPARSEMRSHPNRDGRSFIPAA